MSHTDAEKILVGISSCLLGAPVRYNGGHKRNDYIEKTLGQFFEFVPFCPEVDIGMGVPRPAIRLLAVDGGVRAVGVKDDSVDVTARLDRCAREQKSWHGNLCGYILKKDSPSCGMERVKTYTNGHPSKNGVGLYAARLMANFPLLPVEEEGRLGDPVLRENFLQRVYVFHRWRQLLAQGVSHSALTTFHARHKLLFMSHHQNATRALGKILASGAQRDADQLAEQYIGAAMTLLKTKASRRNHVNVLQHIQGYLKRELEPDDKRELVEIIEQYRLGAVPLIAPITLLRHHFRKNPDQYIAHSCYMQPWPEALRRHDGI